MVKLGEAKNIRIRVNISPQVRAKLHDWMRIAKQKYIS